MRFLKRNSYIILLILLVFLLLASCDLNKKQAYYADKNNYITVIGTVSYIKEDENQSVLYIGVDDMSVELSDNCFKVVGENLTCIYENIYNKPIQIGDTLVFTTAPRYFGDGYIMPIVSITRGNTVLLEFDEGVENLLNWLDS